MSLRDRIDQFRQKFLPKVPVEIQQTMAQATARLRASGAAERSPKKGDKAPDFALPNVDGSTISTEELRTRGPVVLSFYRGAWCPYCNLELKALQERLPEIEALGAQLVAVSPQQPDASAATVERSALTFEVLSDAGNAVARQYGLEFELPRELRPIYSNWGVDLEASNGDDSYTLPMAATYVIDTDGTILEAFVDADYTKRMEPENVIAALEKRN